MFADEPVNDCALAHSSHDDGVRSHAIFRVDDDGPIASNAANVGLQIGRGTHHTAIVVSVNVDPGDKFPVRNGETAGLSGPLHIMPLAERQSRGAKGQVTRKEHQRELDHSPWLPGASHPDILDANAIRCEFFGVVPRSMSAHPDVIEKDALRGRSVPWVRDYPWSLKKPPSIG